MAIELPPAPATAIEAMRQANELAYGFAKHTDVAYWSKYPTDPDYFWKRLLGWQAGGEDAARYGKYANPPSPWRVVEAPAKPPDAPAPPARDEQLERLINVLQRGVVTLETISTQLIDVGNRLKDFRDNGVRARLW